MPKTSRYNALLQARNIPELQRIAAEKKYMELLESALGSASKVRGAYCEYVAVRSLRAEDPRHLDTPEELDAVAQWEKASAEATKRVFSEMKITDSGAFFDLQVWGSHSF